MYGQAVAFAFLAVLGHVHAAEIPDFIHICRRSDPEVENCILESIESLRPKLRDGIPELDVPAMEPLLLPVVKVSEGENGFTALGRNIKVYGASDFQVTKLKLDKSTDTRLTVHMELNLPHLEFEGEYEVNARILVLPINGRGPIKCNATNVKADMVLYGHVHKKGNHNYVRFNKIDMGLKIDDYSIHLENLFNGDRALGEAANQILNDNSKEFVQSVNPYIVKTASELTLEVANKIAKNQPYDILFPK